MNIIDALKTGRRIRRPGFTQWIDPEQGYSLYKPAILAEDWEVEPEPISKPCPFCGSVELVTWRLESHRYIIKCNSCDARSAEGDTPENVSRLWNRRVDVLEKVVKYFDDMQSKYAIAVFNVEEILTILREFQIGDRK